MIKKLTALLSSTALTFSLFVPAVSADQSTVLEAINAATGETIEAAVKSYLEEAGKTEPYASLPACDRTEINERILGNIKYDDYDALSSAYQTALEYTTQVDKSLYKEEFVEDFSSLDAGWIQSQNPPYVGSESMHTDKHKYLNISGNDTSYMGVWGPDLQTSDVYGGNQYITRTLNNPYCIVSGYMYYSSINGNPKAYYGIEGQNNSYWIGTGGGDGEYRYKNGTSWVNNIAANDEAWHKVVYDGLTKPGKIMAYFDGKLQFTVEDKMTELKVGCLDPNANGGLYIVCFDNISVASAKDGVAELWENFNASTITEKTLKAMMTSMGKDGETFSELPGCDKTAIVADLEAKRPFKSIDELRASYQEALENTTGIDIDPTKYSTLLMVDFSNYSNANWTETGMSFRGNQIGTGYMDGIGNQVRKTLNITGEDYSAGFVGGSLASVDENGPPNANYIKRAISDSNSIVTAYFYDNMNDGTPRYNIKVNDKTWVGRTDNSGYFSYAMNESLALTSVTVGTGWHKVVFDGLTNSGTVTVYLDGTQIGQTNQKIEYLQLGNEWTDAGFDIVWMDNISVAVEKREETLSVTCKGSEITALPATGTVQVKVENPDFQNDYIIVGYKDKLPSF
ncbi:MAG: hypothetical protein PUD92_07105, partial [Clostridiales bacterium]|nr:hypothetical protein [Clostridiales bacterium]